MEEKKKSRRGFAGMSKERQREIASIGGLASQAQGVAHKFTSEEAKFAGAKGGATVSKNRQHMSEIGRKGGEARAAKKQKEGNKNG